MEIKSEKITVEPIEKLVSDPKNENIHSDKQIEVLQKLIVANGFRDPLTVSTRSGYVICGNGRLLAAQRLGMEKLPVVYQDFENEAAETRHRIASNEVARHADLDTSKMLENLEELEIDTTKFDFEELGLIDFELPTPAFSLDDDDDDNDTSNDDKKYILQVQLSNELDQSDLYDDLVGKGYLVKKVWFMSR